MVGQHAYTTEHSDEKQLIKMFETQHHLKVARIKDDNIIMHGLGIWLVQWRMQPRNQPRNAASGPNSGSMHAFKIDKLSMKRAIKMQVYTIL